MYKRRIHYIKRHNAARNRLFNLIFYYFYDVTNAVLKNVYLILIIYGSRTLI